MMCHGDIKVLDHDYVILNISSFIA